jgi:UDP-N-acetylmuramoyl-L-alanyl-D-glutamate--2,6-diaminopimelate ligase
VNGFDLDFKGVTCDSRNVKAGDLFVAIDGVNVDGAVFAEEAVKKGAIGVVSSRDIAGLGVPVKIVDDTRKFLGEAASEFLCRPSEKLKVYGITGTNGKTSTTWILASLLSSCGYITTVETDTRTRKFPSDHTTPDAVSLQKLFSEMNEAGLSSCVMEVSSHAIVQKRIAGTRFAGCAFTNLSEDHLDFHKNMSSYFEAKLEFFKYVAEINPGAAAVICMDNPFGEEMLRLVKELPLKVMTCGCSEAVDFKALDVQISASGSSFTLVSNNGESARVNCPLSGRYNVSNVLVASALAFLAGISFTEIAGKIPLLFPRWGRLERVDSQSEADVFIDFAHSNDALENVLSTVREFTKGRVWAVFGAGGNRDVSKRPLMGEAAAKYADKVIITSDNPRNEDPLVIIGHIADGIPPSSSAVIEPDRRAAIKYALENAEKGDSVVICGKGHETCQEIAGVSYPFSDREEVLSYVGKR